MILNWTREPDKKGWYLWAPRGSTFRDGRIKLVHIDPDDELPQSETDALLNGADWYLGPIAGYPTENFGILNQ